MASVIQNRSGAWELRESVRTPKGPRSRTLATFHALTPEVVARAQTRASRPLDADEVRRAAERAGAPVEATPADRAAADLLSALAGGSRPRPALERLLADALAHNGAAPSDAARAAAPWTAASPRQRGETLRDLLLLGDRLPIRRRPERPSFPRIASTAA